ncbi:MAG: valine--tRNA ligase [Lysobacterales bacterium]
MDKSFQPAEIEQRWYQRWEELGVFAPSDAADPYCIMLPPPNVTGRLHMGHAFQHTLQDALTRHQRMAGASALWQCGTDHAGIATQMVVERQLEAEGKKRRDLGRETFTEAVWEWKAQSGGAITQQMRRLGDSVDWTHERFTMDEGLSDAVRHVFVSLFEEGLIYRGKRLVNWDPVLLTALSDLEVISEEENGHLWHLRYPLADGPCGDIDQLIVATTRPETMLGDTAVAVHPDDERYQHLVGKDIALPLSDRRIPIIADSYVDPAFGTGCVKITPAHDFNDYQMGQRHQLPLINIFEPNASLNEAAPEAYRGMDRMAARKAIVADLDTAGLLEKTQDHKLMVPRGDRSGAVVEPYLTDQWYVDLTRQTQPDGRPGGAAAITDPAIEVVRNGRVQFVPGNWDKTYYEWLNNIQDWCISRQLWWGHRIPAWYDDDGRVYVGHSEADVRQRFDLGERHLKQDEDVLDTWFSSGLWPFSTLGWPEKTDRLEKFYPGNVLVTGFDIIFFWVARMIMFGLKFMDDVPFRDVYITGLIRDYQGQKMSKSKGNVLDPLDLIDGIDLEALVAKRTSGLMQPKMAASIEKATRKEFPDGIRAHGTDALRFTFAALATHGRDIRFDTGRIEGYRNFCNKIWNATRYVLMNVEEKSVAPAPETATVFDRWIVSRFHHAADEVNRNFKRYRFDLAAAAIYEFTWHEYCDWYLELTKPVLTADSHPSAQHTRFTLVSVLEQVLRLMHPLMPFITEEIWQRVAPVMHIDGETISTQPFPVLDESRIDSNAEHEVQWLQQVLLGLRQIRGEMDIAPRKPLELLLEAGDTVDRERLAQHQDMLLSLGSLGSCRWLDDGEQAPASAFAAAGKLKLHVPLAGIIDPQEELARINRELERKRQDITRLEGKLSNEKFVANAPDAVVQKSRTQLEEAKSDVTDLEQQVKRLDGL